MRSLTAKPPHLVKHLDVENHYNPGELTRAKGTYTEMRSTGPLYRHIDPAQAVLEALVYLRRHAVLMWVVLPVFVALQSAFEALRPTCDAGYSDWSFILVALLIGHHLWCEAGAWAAAKGLVTTPELHVLRSLGVLRRRRWLVLLGLLEDLNLYNDFTFPLLAYECQASLTDQWARSWKGVPVVGEVFVIVLRHIRFWGITALTVGALALAGAAGICRLMSVSLGGLEEGGALNASDAGEGRLSGRAFFELARRAEAAGTSSVAAFCEEMGSQRRWVFDAKPDLGGALGATRARQSAIFGRLAKEAVQAHELRNEEEQRRVDAAGSAHFRALLVGKVLIGNVLQLWLQASFFELAFTRLGPEAKGKLVGRIAIAAAHMLLRCAVAPCKLDCLGCAVAFLSLTVAAWACAKAYFAFACPSHLWWLATGCLSESHHIHA